MENLIKVIEEVEETDFTGLLINDPNFYESYRLPPLPEYEIIEDPLTASVTVKFSANFPSGSTGYSIVSRPIKIDGIRTCVHDFTLEFFTTRPEEPLSNFFLLEQDGFDHLTPDIIKIIKQKSLVLEFTTSQTTAEASIRRSFEIKVEAYHQALARRALKTNILYGIVVVTRSKVLSNIHLDQEDVDELCFRYRVALDISSKLSHMGYPTREIDEERGDITKVRSAFNLVKPKFNPNSFMGKETYERFFQPANKDYLKRIMMISIDGAKKDLDDLHFSDLDVGTQEDPKHPGRLVSDQILANHRVCLDKIDEFIQEADEGERRYDNKAICPCPLWIPEIGSESTDLAIEPGNYFAFPNLGESNDPTFQIWEQVMIEVNSGSVELLEEDPDKEISIALQPGLEEEFKLNKLKYHRVKPEISDEVAVEIAKVGVFAKNYLENKIVDNYRNEKKKPFSIHVDVEDIEVALEAAIGLSEESDGLLLRTTIQEALLGKALDMHNSPEASKLLDFHHFYSTTMLSRWLMFWSDVCSELALSLKQHCRHGEFIIKKLKSFNVYILIKPTDSTKHIFYSLLTLNDDLQFASRNTTYGKWKTNGVCSWTEFKSYSGSKLVNGIKAESTGLAMLSYWLEFYKLPYWEIDIIKRDYPNEWQDVWKMTLFSILVSLNDKTSLEEQITLSRFIYMESFVCTPCIPRPHKMIEKLNRISRNRLEIWVIHKLLGLIERISSGYHCSLKSVKKDAHWTNLWNPYTQTPLSDPHQVINLMYIGYLKNKDENACPNTLGHLYEKILKYEEMRPPTNQYLGLDDPDYPKFHEYSPSLITEICSAAQTYLRNNNGASWKEQVESEILTRLASINILDVCTLKASSKFSEEHYQPGEKPTRVHRQKVLEVLPSYIEDETDIADIMPRVIEELTEQNCLHIDIFRKPQHGGLREIYVLAIRERLCQLIVETIARAIASFFPSETMTHPKNKFIIPENHSKQATNKLGETHITVATSDDASKWNQAHFVGKFAHILCLMTPTYMHPTIFRITELWMRKRILIDPELMKIIMGSSTRLFANSGMTLLADAYWGRTEPHWMERGNQYIETTTGMLQGIFHYGSTLLHTFYLLYLKSYALSRFTRALKDIGCESTAIISTMQSSDDSSMMISFPSGDNKCIAVGLKTSSLIFYLKKHLSRYLAIYDSPKSTSMTPFMVEFNSEFFFYKNLLRPTFRWVAAVCSISEQESIAGRQEEMSNLLTSVLEGGASYGLTGLCQLAQASLHYRLMGISISSIGHHYFTSLKLVPDPALGFFLLDNPLCPGLAGFNYNLFKSMTDNGLSRKYKMLLQEAKQPGQKSEFLDLTNAGSIVQSTMITWGNRKKWKRIFEGLDLPDDWKEQINADPIILYRKPRDKLSLQLRLAAKASSPGVTASLSKGNVVSRVIASSAYCLSRALSVRGEQMLSDDEITNKVSLFFLLSRDKKLKCETLLEHDLQVLFPRLLEHRALETTLGNIPELTGFIERSSARKTTTTILVSESDPIMLIKPIDLIKRAWFGIDKIPTASRIKNQAWQNMKKTFTWLSEDPQDSLENSPFDNHIQIQNFFARLDGKSRRVRLSGVPLKSRHGMSNITTSIYQNRFSGFKCATVIDLEAERAAKGFSSMNQQLFLIMNAPYTEERAIQEVSKTLHSFPQIPISQSMVRSRRSNLAIIQRFLSTDNDLDVFTLLQSVRMGTYGFFTIRQKFVNGRWRGNFIWTGVVGETSVKLMGRDENLKEVLVNTLNHSAELSLLLPQLFKDLQIVNISHHAGNADAMMFKGKLVHKYFNQGCTVKVVKDLRFVFDPAKIGKLKLEIEDQRLRLISTYAQYKITVLSCYIHPSDLGTEPVTTRGDPTRSWLAFRSMPARTAFTLCTYSEKWVREHGFDYNSYRAWLKELFISTAEAKGLLPPTFDSEYYLETFTEVPLGEFEDDWFDLELDVEVTDFPLPILEEGQADMNVVGEWPEDVSEFARTIRPAEVSLKQKLAGHPLLLDALLHLRKELGNKELSRILQRKEYTTRNQPLLNYILYFMNWTMRDLKEVDYSLETELIEFE